MFFVDIFFYSPRKALVDIHSLNITAHLHREKPEPMSDSHPFDALKTLRKAVDHLDHTLPGQAPLLLFVHHNTLHGYQHLHFAEALACHEQATGIRGYWPDDQFRQIFRHGRILEEDLVAACHGVPGVEETILDVDQRPILRADLYRMALLHGLDAVNSRELAWQIEEMGILEQFQTDVRAESRHRFLNTVRPVT